MNQSKLLHIEGLRGLAILMIILFHLNGGYFGGGFVGVDVFLVITGYLLFKRPSSFDDGKNFVKKKILRIFPPVYILCLLVVPFALWVLCYSDVLEFAFTMLSTVFGCTNIYLDQANSGYFAVDTNWNPILHLWYIGCTVQAYLIFLVGSKVFRCVPRRIFIATCIIIATLSWIYCYNNGIINHAEKLGFIWGKYTLHTSHYMLLPRMWEILAGGLVLLLPRINNRALATAFCTIGLALILSIYGINYLYAQLYRTAVVVGTVLVLAYAPSTVCNKILTNKLLLWFGSISFSLYLIHVPIYTLCRVYALETSSLFLAVQFIVSIALGWAFYRLVERRHFSIGATFILGIACTVVAASLVALEGLKGRIHPEADRVGITTYKLWEECSEPQILKGLDTDTVKFWDGVFRMTNQSKPYPDVKSPLLYIGGKGEAHFALMGDSHAGAMYAGFDDLFRENGWHGIFFSTIVIPISGYLQYDGITGHDFNPQKEEAIMKWLEEHGEITDVLFVWTHRFAQGEQRIAACEKFLQRLRSMGKEVWIFGPLPGIQTHATVSYARKYRLRAYNKPIPMLTCAENSFSKSLDAILPIYERMESKGLCHLIPAHEALFKDGIFNALEGDHLLLIDSNHYSPTGAVKIIRSLENTIRAIMTKNPKKE